MGTSQFTHEDDNRTPLHPSDPEHHDALHYGGQVPPKNQLVEIILGPPAFGSPDPRTLGHRMNPLEDRPASAPALDPSFEELQGRTDNTVVVTEDELSQMSKAELRDLVDGTGVDVSSSATKQELIDALTGNESNDDDSSDSDDES